MIFSQTGIGISDALTVNVSKDALTVELDDGRGIEGHHIGHGEQLRRLGLAPLVDLTDRKGQEGQQEANTERGSNRQGNSFANAVMRTQRSAPMTF